MLRIGDIIQALGVNRGFMQQKTLISFCLELTQWSNSAYATSAGLWAPAISCAIIRSLLWQTQKAKYT